MQDPWKALSLRASSGTKRPLKFDPTDDSVCSEAHRRKKAAIPGRGRAKKVKVVLLKSIPSSIPKGSQRDKLKKAGRIMD